MRDNKTGNVPKPRTVLDQLEVRAMLSKQAKLITLVITSSLSAVLLLDILTGLKPSNEIVTYLKTYEQAGFRGGGGQTVYGFITNKGEYPSSANLLTLINKGDTIEIFKTKILGELTKIKVAEQVIKNETYSIYNHASFFPLVCIISSILAIAFRTRNEGTYDTFLIISSLILIYLAISTFTNNSV